MAIAAGLRELEELEQSEEPFNEQSDGGSESDAEDEEEGKLSRSLEDIDAELKKRANLAAELYPKTQLPATTTCVPLVSFRFSPDDGFRLEPMRKRRFVFATNV